MSRREDIEREIEFHLEETIGQLKASGMSDADARAEAARRFGNVAGHRLRIERAGDAALGPQLSFTERASELFSVVISELRQALRSLLRAPAYALTVIATLALVIGANVTMFSIADGLMFRPLRYLRDPGSVKRAYWQWMDKGALVTGGSTQFARFTDLQRGTQSFSETAVFAERSVPVGDGDRTQEQRIAAVSASYFHFFDAAPVRGRFFTSAEDVIPLGTEVAVLGYGFWQSQFGGRDVVGETLRIGNMRATIVGVAPRGFDGLNDGRPPAAFVPVTAFATSTGTGDSRTYSTAYTWGWVHIFARLKSGVTIDAANDDASAVFRASWPQTVADNRSMPALDQASPRVVMGAMRPGAGPTPGTDARTSVWLIGVALTVLVIGCANVANLSLARALERSREITVKKALGIARGRLLLGVFAESFLVSAVGGAAALVVATALTAAFAPMLRTLRIPEVSAFSDARVLAVTMILIAGVAAAIGLIAALAVGHQNLSSALRSGGRGSTNDGRRVRAALMFAQAMLSVVLLVGAALFVRSLVAVKTAPMGYDASRVVVMNRTNAGPFDAEKDRALRADLLPAALSLPEVESAAWMSSAPFVSTSSTDLFVDDANVTARGPFTFQATTSGYFKTMGTRVVRGRELQAGDAAGAPPVVVVSESMARTLWPERDPLGQCVKMRLVSEPCRTVVGIAEDMVQRALDDSPRLHYYLPIDQYPRTNGNGLLLKLRSDPKLGAERVRTALQTRMPAGGFMVATPLASIVETQQAPWWMGASILVSFGVLALIVAGVGLYGTVAYGIAQRSQEWAIRVALGASRRSIGALIIGSSIRVIVIGIVPGLLIAAALGRYVRPLLYRTSAIDPVAYIVVTCIMLTIALVASAAPAMRAANSDPNRALRGE